MPGGDKTGPFGEGPLSGRGMGYCRGSNRPGFANSRGGRGMGAGYGRGIGGGGGYGRGWRHRYFDTGVPGWAWNRGYIDVPETSPQSRAASRSTREDELEYLRAESIRLEGALKDISRQIAELEKRKEA